MTDAAASGRDEATGGSLLRRAASALRSRCTRAHLIIGLCAAAQTFAVWGTMDGLGMTWDEAYYFEPHESAIRWLGEWVRGDLGPAGHDAHWAETWELPAVPRFVHGLSGWLFGDTGFANRHLFAPLVAQRMLSGVAHGVNCALIALLLLPVVGLTPALAALLGYAAMPRIFGHAHFAATETLMVTMTLLVTWAFLRGLRSWRGAVLTGVLFGLALNTKFNLLLLPLSLWVWAVWWHRRRSLKNIAAMALLAPLVWLLTWPWLWSDTIPKVADYLRHFLAHQQTAVWFHGARWGFGQPTAPWYYPLEMIAVTVPIPTLLLALLGLGVALRRRDEGGHGALFALLAVVPLGVACLPGVPRYDGVRLFFPVFAPLALMVGLAVAWLRDLVAVRWPGVGARRIFAAAALTVVALPGAVAIARLHPFELSHFNTLGGGINGAERRGYEITHWCETINEPVIAHLNEALPEGASLHGLAMHMKILEHLQRWDVLRGDIALTEEIGLPGEWLIIQGRRGFFREVETFLWEQWAPRGSRRFGWPLGESPPRVVTCAIAPGGPEFAAALQRDIGAGPLTSAQVE